MEDKAQAPGGDRLGQHMLPNMAHAESCAFEDYSPLQGLAGADDVAKGLAAIVEKDQLSRRNLTSLIPSI